MPSKEELKNEKRKEHKSKGLLRTDDTVDELFRKITNMYDESLKISDPKAYAEYSKEIAATRAEWYERIAGKHDKVAQDERRLMFINGTIAVIDASLVAYSVILTSAANEFAFVAAISGGVLASALTAVTAHLSKFNKRIASLRRREAAEYRFKSLPETSEQ